MSWSTSGFVEDGVSLVARAWCYTDRDDLAAPPDRRHSRRCACGRAVELNRHGWTVIDRTAEGGIRQPPPCSQEPSGYGICQIEVTRSYGIGEVSIPGDPGHRVELGLHGFNGCRHRGRWGERHCRNGSGGTD